MVPRIKKRGKVLRREFKERKLHRDIGRLIEQLIELNVSARSTSIEWHKNGASSLKPLFQRKKQNAKWVDTDAEKYAWFFEPHEVSRILINAISKLNVPTALDPETSIRATPRRLRYTFATRLVQEGASHQAVAEALDHSDLQHVMIYFNVRNDMVNFLDRAHPKLIAVAQTFAGTLISDESQAERGNDPKSRIFPPPATRSIKPVGNCGSYAFCNEAAPIACYTCIYFRPWKDAPHHLVFDFLMDQRQRKIDANADIKNIQIHDVTIRAVAHVIELCGDADTHEAA